MNVDDLLLLVTFLMERLIGPDENELIKAAAEDSSLAEKHAFWLEENEYPIGAALVRQGLRLPVIGPEMCARCGKFARVLLGFMSGKPVLDERCASCINKGWRRRDDGYLGWTRKV